MDVKMVVMMVVVKMMEVEEEPPPPSLCEHHMVPFMGRVSIGYLPRGKVGCCALCRALRAEQGGLFAGVANINLVSCTDIWRKVTNSSLRSISAKFHCTWR